MTITEVCPTCARPAHESRMGAPCYECVPQSTTRPPAPVEPGSEREAWYSIESAPKDATILELLVDYTDGSGPLQDGTVVPTVGWNALADTGEDEWQFFGWNWCQDYICAGKGRVIAWRPSRLNGCDDALGLILARPAADDAK